nr:hypothetical protein [Anoxybacillus gonensis]
MRNGESLDDILKDCEIVREEKDMANKIALTVEEYIDLRRQGLSDAVIAAIKNITKKQLYNWKSFRKEQIAKLEKELEQQAGSQEAVDHESPDVETTLEAEDDAGIEWLKREAIHAHKMLTKKENECERLKQEVEHYKELFETAMTDKEWLHKENLFLENHVQRLKESISELTERNERYFASLTRLEQEVKCLRLYALQKLHMDVYGA